jgi:hypothetical protein
MDTIFSARKGVRKEKGYGSVLHVRESYRIWLSLAHMRKEQDIAQSRTCEKELSLTHVRKGKDMTHSGTNEKGTGYSSV